MDTTQLLFDSSLLAQVLYLYPIQSAMIALRIEYTYQRTNTLIRGPDQYQCRAPRLILLIHVSFNISFLCTVAYDCHDVITERARCCTNPDCNARQGSNNPHYQYLITGLQASWIE